MCRKTMPDKSVPIEIEICDSLHRFKYKNTFSSSISLFFYIYIWSKPRSRCDFMSSYVPIAASASKPFQPLWLTLRLNEHASLVEIKSTPKKQISDSSVSFFVSIKLTEKQGHSSVDKTFYENINIVTLTDSRFVLTTEQNKKFISVFAINGFSEMQCT